METGEVVTKAELARRIGRSPARVSQLIRDGRLAPPALLVDGRIDLVAAMAQLSPFLEAAPAPVSRPPPAAPGPMAEAKLRLAQAQAARAEADLEAARGVHRRDALTGAVTAADYIMEQWKAAAERYRVDLVVTVRSAGTEREAHEAARRLERELMAELRQIALAEAGRAGADLPEADRRAIEAQLAR